MSAEYPPPQQPAPGQNPYAQQPYGAPQQPPPFGYGQPPQNGDPYGPPPQGTPYGQPPAYGQQPGYGQHPGFFAPPAARDNPGLGILLGFVTAIAVAVAYGWMIGLTKHEISYAAVGVGFAVGAVVGKAGGRNPALPYAGLVLAALGVFLGQYFGEAILISKASDLSTSTLLTDYTNDVFQVWKQDSDFMAFVFMAVAAAIGFTVPRRING
jgi:hypothetical protein